MGRRELSDASDPHRDEFFNESELFTRCCLTEVAEQTADSSPLVVCHWLTAFGSRLRVWVREDIQRFVHGEGSPLVRCIASDSNHDAAQRA